MSDTAVAAHTIGQTPRPDLVADLESRFPSVRFQVVGALDGLAAGQIPARGPERVPDARPGGYPLETRLRDGARVLVEAAFVESRLQRSIDVLDDRVALHLVLCAGPFPGLRARRPLIRPFDAAVTELKRRGLASLEVVVPFRAQRAHAARKWEAAGFGCRARVLTDKPSDRSLAAWLTGGRTPTGAQALVFDYVGFPAELLDEVAAAIDLPVFDLGHLALDSLERTLSAP